MASYNNYITFSSYHVCFWYFYASKIRKNLFNASDFRKYFFKHIKRFQWLFLCHLAGKLQFSNKSSIQLYIRSSFEKYRLGVASRLRITTLYLHNIKLHNHSVTSWCNWTFESYLFPHIFQTENYEHTER